MSKCSPELHGFYVAMQNWIDAGCGAHPLFDAGDSLCANLKNFVLTSDERSSDVCLLLMNEMRRQFADMGLSMWYPFNNASCDDYHLKEVDRYLNKRRLAWVLRFASV